MLMSELEDRGPEKHDTEACPSRLLVILSATKDLAERSDTGRAAGVRSFAALRTTANEAAYSPARNSMQSISGRF
jgi:hypothetical protein